MSIRPESPIVEQPNPGALPSIHATRKALVDLVIRSAIAGYHQAERAKAEAEESFGEDPQLDPLMCVVINRYLDAQRTLVRAILNFDPSTGALTSKGSGYRPESKLWPARGVECDGRLYLVAPDPGRASGMRIGEASEHGDNVMQLTVLPASDVSDVGTLEGDPVYTPSGERVWHIDDPGADVDEDRGEERISGNSSHKGKPSEEVASTTIVERIPQPSEADAPTRRRGHPFDQADDIPRPLLRQTMTIVPPWDNGSDATLEVIVLAEPADDDDVTARRHDVAVLSEAGWGSTSMKGLQVFMRVLG